MEIYWYTACSLFTTITEVINQPVEAINAPPAGAGGKTPPSISDVQRDKYGRPLVLAPEHCSKMKKYAEMYGVHDVVNWVKSNCSFAKMYLPKASCEEINVLVASCYKDDKQH
ncbi:hypothetical protein WR25_18314 [Diploscapter pachys]|uniref:aECM cysteine-cradle domain-containing protein n=1 Tax=Diploscapter pachys TaxID=2018661 RepID=A0A2A2L0D5_9BILA|nr:hypothetical protein WR25_18314 [Diploscapter pachys]